MGHYLSPPLLDFITFLATKTVALENGERETLPVQLQGSAGREKGRAVSGGLSFPPIPYLFQTFR